MDIQEVTTLDAGYFPACPYCEELIQQDALVIKHNSEGYMALAHRQCVEGAEHAASI
ncbi:MULTISPECIES: hypothetical protein [Vibrio]|uniref:hypothetical protein n=1 Tax=Vibrio TaxID=662 RepID=UPI0020753B08|nr:MULTISPECIES: hypothetical protein [Vibrio]USD35579.1 hypothetical protein J8Z27_22465 [Vibrio sp. SCSIO 43186]USD72703.1 hypothetical protein J4N41_22480 [Vibrio sp. SCSIO 43139]